MPPKRRTTAELAKIEKRLATAVSFFAQLKRAPDSDLADRGTPWSMRCVCTRCFKSEERRCGAQ